MAAFLLFDKARTWYGSSGQLLAGGYLTFYQVDTTTLQDVYGNRDLSTNNGDTIALDASGRLEHECWGDTADSYFVEVYDADDVKQAEISYIEVPGGAAQVIPVPSSGEYLSGDGTNFALVDLTDYLLPDQTGHSNEILGTDGTTAAWVARPADGAAGAAANVAAAAGSFTTDDGTDTFQILTGAATAAASGAPSASNSVTFSAAFLSTPSVVVTPTSDSNSGGPAVPEITSISTTGFTVAFDIAEGGGSSSGINVTNDIPYNWIAVGLKP